MYNSMSKQIFKDNLISYQNFTKEVEVWNQQVYAMIPIVENWKEYD